jgi:hypothetical protein
MLNHRRPAPFLLIVFVILTLKPCIFSPAAASTETKNLFPVEQPRCVLSSTTDSKVLSNVPSYGWVFGSAAVSAAMIAGYYDIYGYPNIYTGPTNRGEIPLNDDIWGTWNDGWRTYPNNPLVASRLGLDGRETRGTIDDYWVGYGSQQLDPFIDNWEEHTWGTAIGDFMKTSQSTYDNDDGETAFYYYKNASQMTCDTLAEWGVDHLDSTYGRKLFYEARGYIVTDCYNQMTDNQFSGGFSLADYQSEIDAGRPVLFNLVDYFLKEHSVVGYGYQGSTIYIRDPWHPDSEDRLSLPWDGFYDDMAIKSVSIVNLSLPAPMHFEKISPVDAATDVFVTITLLWSPSSWASSYEYCIESSIDGLCSEWLPAGDGTSVTLSGLSKGTHYTWQVRAVNHEGVAYADGGESEYWSFTTGEKFHKYYFPIMHIN